MDFAGKLLRAGGIWEPRHWCFLAGPNSLGVWRSPTRCRHILPTYPGYYFTGDGARRDEDGYYWITGRVDDVMNVSGHRIGTAEVESALVLHPAVAEAAVVGLPHDLKGEGIYAFVTLMSGDNQTPLNSRRTCRHGWAEIGPIAKPDAINGLRVYRKLDPAKLCAEFWENCRWRARQSWRYIDLADPSVVENLISNRIQP